MSYRPICDFWWLARAKLLGGRKYYGAYLGGFPERARALLGCTAMQPVLHVCGGMARYYPYQNPGRGFGPYDKTLDMDPATQPDFLQDAREAWPHGPDPDGDLSWGGFLLDPPYSEADAVNYVPGAENYPKPNTLIKRAWEVMKPGQREGLIHYIVPQAPTGAIFVASVGIGCGFNNRVRVYTVFEKPLETSS